MWAQPAPDPGYVGHCCHHTNRVPWGTSVAFFKVSSKPFAWRLALLQALGSSPSPADESKQWTPGPGSPGGRGESVCAGSSARCAASLAMTPGPWAWGSLAKEALLRRARGCAHASPPGALAAVLTREALINPSRPHQAETAPRCATQCLQSLHCLRLITHCPPSRVLVTATKAAAIFDKCFL